MMEWLNDLSNKVESFFNSVANHPKAGHWMIIALLAFWLLGIILNWKWTYQPSGWLSNTLLNELGPSTIRSFTGLLLVVALVIAIYFLIKSYK